MLLLTAVHVGPVKERRQLIELLPHPPPAHGGRPDEVEAGGGEVDPGVEPVPGRDGNREALRVTQTRLGTTIKTFCNRKIIICGNLVTFRINTTPSSGCTFPRRLREGLENFLQEIFGKFYLQFFTTLICI